MDTSQDSFYTKDTPDLPLIPDHVGLCVAAFLTDRRCKRLLNRMLDGTPILTLQLNETVLKAIGHDVRGWRDWTDATREALDIVMNLKLVRWKRAA
jgi:hypothetical protein